MWGQDIPNQSKVNSISFPIHELLTHVIVGPRVATCATDMEMLYL